MPSMFPSPEERARLAAESARKAAKRAEDPEGYDLNQLKIKALDGDAASQYFLGWAYFDGKGVPKDDARAVEWWEKSESGQQRNPRMGTLTKYMLGRMYRDGKGVPKDETKAADWFEKAANQGMPEPKSTLELCITKAKASRKAKRQRSSGLERPPFRETHLRSKS